MHNMDVVGYSSETIKQLISMKPVVRSGAVYIF